LLFRVTAPAKYLVLLLQSLPVALCTTESQLNLDLLRADLGSDTAARGVVCDDVEIVARGANAANKILPPQALGGCIGGVGLTLPPQPAVTVTKAAMNTAASCSRRRRPRRA
jgi:hypothetical protein